MICNIFGNHEQSIISKQYDRFSSERGENSARYTEKILTDDSRKYFENNSEKKCYKEFFIKEKRFLAVHGSLEDYAWIGIDPEINIMT